MYREWKKIELYEFGNNKAEEKGGRKGYAG
jgi:hypothetical protein